MSSLYLAVEVALLNRWLWCSFVWGVSEEASSEPWSVQSDVEGSSHSLLLWLQLRKCSAELMQGSPAWCCFWVVTTGFSWLWVTAAWTGCPWLWQYEVSRVLLLPKQGASHVSIAPGVRSVATLGPVVNSRERLRCYFYLESWNEGTRSTWFKTPLFDYSGCSCY